MNLKDIDGLPDILPVEKLKLRIEYERIKIERYKMWLTSFSIFIPLIIGAGTIAYGVWSENQRAKSSFEIKAVEIVMNASSPTAATNKTIVLSELFPNHMPKNFKAKMLAMYGKSQQDTESK